MSISNKFKSMLCKFGKDIIKYNNLYKINNSMDIIKYNNYKKTTLRYLLENINKLDVIKSTCVFNNYIFNTTASYIDDFEKYYSLITSNLHMIDYMTEEQKNIIKSFCDYTKKNSSLNVKQFYTAVLFDKILYNWLKNSPTSYDEKNKLISIIPEYSSIIHSCPEFSNFSNFNETQIDQIIILFKEINDQYKDIDKINKITPNQNIIKTIDDMPLFSYKVSKITNNETPKNRYVKKRIPRKLRLDVWDKYIGDDKRQGNCYVCNYKIDITDFEAGHIIAEVNGGKTNLENLRPICKNCNRSVATMNMNEYKKTYYS